MAETESLKEKLKKPGHPLSMARAGLASFLISAASFYCIPSFLRFIKQTDQSEKGPRSHSIEEYNQSIIVLAGAFLGQMSYAPQAIFYFENPRYLIIPAITNALSGYSVLMDKYREARKKYD